MIVAKFKGPKRSMGFVPGEVYKLRTSIEPIAGHGHCLVIRDMESACWCPYSSLENFLFNWQIKETRGFINYK